MKTFRCNRDTAVVSTTKGKIRGYEYDGLTIFKGVPYAEAERFHAPKELEAWEGVLECNSYGFVCPLLELEKPNGELCVPHRYWAMDEHCQNLNLWTPACDDQKRPVVVWLHGGGYEAGSSIEHWAYEGEQMSKLADVVVVSVNHRLNVLGYFDLSEFGAEYENSGNAGTDDIIAALRWVRDNISTFGGDPNQVTVMGQSGGGAKVTTLLQSPEADGLFHRGIIMSGNYFPLQHDETGSGRELAEAIMKDLGIENVKELEQVKYDRLAESYRKLRPSFEQQGKYVGGSPHPNRHYAGLPPMVPFREETKEIPILIGTVFGEFAAFVTENYDRSRVTREDAVRMIEAAIGADAAKTVIPMFEKAYPERHLVDLLTLDFIFRGPNIPYVTARAALNDCTYSYLFNHNSAMDYERVPWHCFDVPFAFHNIDLVPTAMFEGAEVLQEQFFNSFVSFIKTGNPNNPDVPKWNPDTKEEETVMIFDTEPHPAVNHDHELVSAMAQHMGPVFMKLMMEGRDRAQH